MTRCSLVLAFLPCVASSDEFSDATTALGNGDLDLALTRYRDGVRRNDPRCAHALATLYAQGKRVKADATVALRLYRMAARLKHVKAQVALGRALESGALGERDYGRSAKWYLAAADQGDPEGLEEAGRLLLLGIGVTRDRSRGLKLLEAATKKGRGLAAYHLYGALLKTQPKAARRWLRIGAERGVAGAQCDLAQFLERRGSSALDEAVRWYRKAAANSGRAAWHLARLYGLGIGVSQDSEASMKWLRKAVQFDYAPAQFRLAAILEKREGSKAARALYRRAAEQGYALAQLRIAELKEERGDSKACFYWLRQAAGNDHAWAQLKLARAYESGSGVQRSLVHAYAWAVVASRHSDWLLELALHDDLSAKNEVGRLRGLLSEEQIKRGNALVARITPKRDN